MNLPAEDVQRTTSASCPTGRAKPVPRRVMRERRLLCRPKRRYQATTDSIHSETRFSNLLPHVIPTRPDQVWQADLTYVRVKQGFVYLACVLDSFTREVVGWSMSRFMDAALPLAALNNALVARCPAAGLRHHPDQRAGPIRVPFCPRRGSNMRVGYTWTACGPWA
jgi:transposase InsO family protein